MLHEQQFAKTSSFIVYAIKIQITNYYNMKTSLLFQSLSFIVALLLPHYATAIEFKVDDLYYSINSDSTSVTVASPPYGNPYDFGDLVIPETVSYNGSSYSVTDIGNSAFEGCSSMTSVTIPNSVISIGSTAFWQCI